MNPVTIFPNPSNGASAAPPNPVTSEPIASGSPILPMPTVRRQPILFESKSTRRIRPLGEPDYAGRLLCLNPEYARRSFQCYGFLLGGPKNQSGLVPEQADMVAIQRALAEGCLLDITEEGEIKTEHSTLSGLEETSTEKKVYLLRRESGETVAFGTADKSQQEEFDKAISERGRIELPPGYGEEEKYLLKTEQPSVEELQYGRELLRASKLPWPRRAWLLIKRQLWRYWTRNQ